MITDARRVGAARRALLVRDGLGAVAEWEQQHGKLTETELQAARQRVADEIIASTDHGSA